MAINLTRALCGRTLTQQMNVLRSPIYRNVGIKVVAAPGIDKLTYEEKNSQLKRVLSPHLTIYKFQLTAVLSITHRFTGMALSGYAAALGLGALVLPHDFASYITIIEGLKLSAPTLAIIKFYLAFPATYHTFNGIRHLSWDMGKFLKLKEVYSTGYLMLGVSFVVAAILAAL